MSGTSRPSLRWWPFAIAVPLLIGLFVLAKMTSERADRPSRRTRGRAGRGGGRLRDLGRATLVEHLGSAGAVDVRRQLAAAWPAAFGCARSTRAGRRPDRARRTGPRCSRSTPDPVPASLRPDVRGWGVRDRVGDRGWNNHESRRDLRSAGSHADHGLVRVHHRSGRVRDREGPAGPVGDAGGHGAVSGGHGHFRDHRAARARLPAIHQQPEGGSPLSAGHAGRSCRQRSMGSRSTRAAWHR